MIPFFAGLPTCFIAFFRSRYNLSLEIIALRQQLGVLNRKTPRPRLRRRVVRDRRRAQARGRVPHEHGKDGEHAAGVGVEWRGLN